MVFDINLESFVRTTETSKPYRLEQYKTLRPISEKLCEQLAHRREYDAVTIHHRPCRNVDCVDCRCSKELNQWETLTEYGNAKGNTNCHLVLESAWRQSNYWAIVKDAVSQVTTDIIL